MGIFVSTADYLDFKSFASNLPVKSQVYYFNGGGSVPFNAFALDNELRSLVKLGIASGGMPVGFTTDFPSAIALDSGGTSVSIV